MVKNYGQEKDRTVIIRKLLAAAFEEQDVSFKKVADFCGVQPQAVYKWKKTGKIARDNAPKVAAFFGKPPGWLIDDRPEKAQEPSSEYNQEAMPASFRELIDVMKSLPSSARHDIHNLVRDLAKVLRHWK